MSALPPKADIRTLLSIRSIYGDHGTQWQEAAIPPQHGRIKTGRATAVQKTERSCIEAYPGRDARTRQTKLLIPIWRTQLSYNRYCQRLLGIFLIHHIE